MSISASVNGKSGQGLLFGILRGNETDKKPNGKVVKVASSATVKIRHEGRIYVVKIMNVTPEIAAKWLTRNPNNRNACDHSVKRLTVALTSGAFLFNGETIIFDFHKNLMDGQHRLMACVRSGVAFCALVIVGIDPEAMKTLGGARKRTGADVLHMNGYSNTTTLSAIASLHVRAAAGGLWMSHAQPAAYETLEIVQDNPDMPTAAAVGMRLKKLVAASVAGYSYFAMARKDPRLALDFFAKIESGAGLEENDPAFRLREKLRDIRGTKSMTLETDAGIALFYQAWNFARSGRPSKQKIKMWNGDPAHYPSID